MEQFVTFSRFVKQSIKVGYTLVSHLAASGLDWFQQIFRLADAQLTIRYSVPVSVGELWNGPAI